MKRSRHIFLLVGLLLLSLPCWSQSSLDDEAAFFQASQVSEVLYWVNDARIHKHLVPAVLTSPALCHVSLIVAGNVYELGRPDHNSMPWSEKQEYLRVFAEDFGEEHLLYYYDIFELIGVAPSLKPKDYAHAFDELPLHRAILYRRNARWIGAGVCGPFVVVYVAVPK